MGENSNVETILGDPLLNMSITILTKEIVVKVMMPMDMRDPG